MMLKGLSNLHDYIAVGRRLSSSVCAAWTQLIRLMNEVVLLPEPSLCELYSRSQMCGACPPVKR